MSSVSKQSVYQALDEWVKCHPSTCQCVFDPQSSLFDYFTRKKCLRQEKWEIYVTLRDQSPEFARDMATRRARYKLPRLKNGGVWLG